MSESIKERPILFNAPMVRAIIDGTKTQTRRVMKVQPPSAEYKLSTCIDTTGNKKDKGRQHWITMQGQYSVGDSSQPYFSCPFGYAGDQLWVRENFQPIYAEGWDEGRNPDGSGDPVDYKTGHGYAPSYPATDGIEEFYDEQTEEISSRVWPSIHMPKWASRIQLEITGVRVERLNDISEEDATDEGITSEQVIIGAHCGGGTHTEVSGIRHFYDGGDDEGYECATEAYKALWESINGEGSWDANHWVWVIEFKVIKP